MTLVHILEKSLPYSRSRTTNDKQTSHPGAGHSSFLISHLQSPSTVHKFLAEQRHVGWGEADTGVTDGNRFNGYNSQGWEKCHPWSAPSLVVLPPNTLHSGISPSLESSTWLPGHSFVGFSLTPALKEWKARVYQPQQSLCGDELKLNSWSRSTAGLSHSVIIEKQQQKSHIHLQIYLPPSLWSHGQQLFLSLKHSRS